MEKKEKNIKKKRIICLSTAAVVIVMFAAVLIILRIPSRAVNKIRSVCNKDVTIYEESIDVEGLNEPYKIIFVADAHIALSDSRDAQLKDISDARYNEFVRDSKGADRNFSILMKKVRDENPDLVIFGGDITDAATYASVEYVKKEIDKLECPYIYCMGNHDFMYGDEYFTQKAYSEYRTRFDSFDTLDNGCDLFEFDKFAILAADDGNNQVGEKIGSVIEKAQNTGKPVMVVTHVPFVPTYGESDLISETNKVWGTAYLDYSRVLMGEHANPPDANTSKLIEYVSDESGKVFLVLSGHVHFYHKDYMKEDTFQITAPGAYERAFLEVTLY